MDKFEFLIGCVSILTSSIVGINVFECFLMQVLVICAIYFPMFIGGVLFYHRVTGY